MGTIVTYDIDSNGEPDRGFTKPIVIEGMSSSYPAAMMKDAPPRKPRGFAAMSPEKRAEISSLGGKRAHEKGTAHKFDAESAREAAKRVKNRKSFDSESGRAAALKAREILTEARKEAGVDVEVGTDG